MPSFPERPHQEYPVLHDAANICADLHTQYVQAMSENDYLTLVHTGSGLFKAQFHITDVAALRAQISYLNGWDNDLAPSERRKHTLECYHILHQDSPFVFDVPLVTEIEQRLTSLSSNSKEGIWLLAKKIACIYNLNEDACMTSAAMRWNTVNRFNERISWLPNVPFITSSLPLWKKELAMLHEGLLSYYDSLFHLVSEKNSIPV